VFAVDICSSYTMGLTHYLSFSTARTPGNLGKRPC